MTKKKRQISPDQNKARTILDELWNDVLAEKEGEIDTDIDKLINSKLVAIRFCLPTQLLGKLTDHKLDGLCLQAGDGSVESKWDPRSFASKVIVPWISTNQNILGTSGDPYVSNPLRKPRLEPDPGQVRGKEDWMLLFEVLNGVEQKDDPSFTKQRMIQALRSVRKKLTESTFEFVVPGRLSLESTRSIVKTFLSEGSGGDRGLAVATALFETFGKIFGIYDEVRRHAINASDASTGQSADIECIGPGGSIRIAIEVKERDLTVLDVRGGLIKARKGGTREVLFNAPRINPTEEVDVMELFARSWNTGTNLYQLTIDELIKVGLSLAGEPARRLFLEKVGEQLNTYNTQPANRLRWKELLEAL